MGGPFFWCENHKYWLSLCPLSFFPFCGSRKISWFTGNVYRSFHCTCAFHLMSPIPSVSEDLRVILLVICSLLSPEGGLASCAAGCLVVCAAGGLASCAAGCLVVCAAGCLPVCAAGGLAVCAAAGLASCAEGGLAVGPIKIVFGSFAKTMPREVRHRFSKPIASVPHL
jgi:hypothetical protein